MAREALAPRTLALATAGLVTLPGMLQAEEKLNFVQGSPITLSGYVDTSAILRVGESSDAGGSKPFPNTYRSPGRLYDVPAKANGFIVEVTDSRLVDPKANHWPLPDAAERKRYHGEQAALAEKEKQWFAAAFHLGRLLFDAPDDADLKRRREQALKGYADAGKEKWK